MPLHGHPFRASYTTTGSADASTQTTGGFPTKTTSAATQAAFTGTPANTAGQQIGGTGGGTAHNNMQPSMALNWIVKA
jgi:microcystin-dependent protein